jgi:hypothetical protein
VILPSLVVRRHSSKAERKPIVKGLLAGANRKSNGGKTAQKCQRASGRKRVVGVAGLEIGIEIDRPIRPVAQSRELSDFEGSSAH